MRWRRRAHELLSGDHVDDVASRLVNYTIVTLILASVVGFMLETVEPIRAEHGFWLVALETGAVAVFTVEYLGRVWAAPEDERYEGALVGRLRWMASPLGLIDLLAILPFYLGFLFPTDLILLRLLRLFRVLRLAKIARYSRALKTMTRVVRRKRRELAMGFFTLTLFLVLAAWAMWLVERNVQPEAFSSVPETLWWAVITLTTVGYGDVVPVTDPGQVLAGVLAVIGLGFIALPSGILASGFVEELQEQIRAEEEAGNELPARCPHCGEAIRD